MSRKDFILIASVLAHAGLSPADTQKVGRLFAITLASVEPRFDSKRFLASILDEQ